MSGVPARPKIYHITHVDNLERIVAAGGLVSDRVIAERDESAQRIGMDSIKRRRLDELKVGCHPGTKVGDYVPFYFCPRSIMLYVIHRANHPDLAYRGGQEPIVHLVADLLRVVAWAGEHDVRWAFSLSNAGARFTEFRSRLDDLHELQWDAIRASDFQAPKVKHSKQAEFLLHGRFPLDLLECVGVRSPAVREGARAALETARSAVPIEVRPEWYF